jgi:hypothetical protein
MAEKYYGDEYGLVKPTVRIKHDDLPNGVVINQEDFVEGTHELFPDMVPEVSTGDSAPATPPAAPQAGAPAIVPPTPEEIMSSLASCNRTVIAGWAKKNLGLDLNADDDKAAMIETVRVALLAKIGGAN